MEAQIFREELICSRQTRYDSDKVILLRVNSRYFENQLNKMKFLKTILKGKLTGLGLVGVLTNDLLSNLDAVAPTFQNAVGSEASGLQIVSAVAVIWGVFRRFSSQYKAA